MNKILEELKQDRFVIVCPEPYEGVTGPWTLQEVAGVLAVYANRPVHPSCGVHTIELIEVTND